ncbi:hypothetical protein Pla175_22620 [Pirellulimonas nuda]|uniref:Endo-beta-1,6-galactanase-like domain-containing protein n=1 Tax=Pirellulimonas nuda TaxID=2528009 RepID=A0A518DBN6_9BACT|nr:glycoside hydrolase [Pirellulimonas nuda]QDU88878.1 hypothetical protein Pla175_22620 [Pirellulimonas nuda]
MQFSRTWLAALVAAACGTAASEAAATDIRTDSGSFEQRFEAWGTSLAWMGNELGASTSGSRRDQIMDLLFDQNNGLGLNFVRYNIGAGQNPAGPAITRPGGDIAGWVPSAPANASDPSTWVWDWNADATQRLILNEAIERGVTQVEAFANSAPWWMTESLSSTGAPKVNNVAQNNLSTDNYDVFGEYLLDVSEHFESNLGIQFNTLSPMNEPGTSFWNGGSNQEGMNISTGSAQSALIREIGQQLVDRGSAVGLVGPEETTSGRTATSFAQWGSATRSYLDRVNTHSYSYSWSSSDADSAAALAGLVASRPSSTQTIYATEFGTGGNSTPLSGGITLANQISNDLRHLGAAGWTYWQAVEDNNGSNWGMLIAPFNGTNTWFNMRKQYYAMQHFSAHIRPGSQILDQSNDETVAAYDPRSSTTVLVVTNDEDAVDSNAYTMLDRSAAYTRVIRTDASGNYRSYGPAAVRGNQISMTATEQSITTILIYDQPNLIQNANFSLGSAGNGANSIDGWQAQGQAAFDSSRDNSGDSSGSGRLLTNSVRNFGKIYQAGIGGADTDLTGVGYQLSLDVQFQNAGAANYDAKTYLSVEFYGADDQSLAHGSVSDYKTLIVPALGIDQSGGVDSDYRSYYSGTFVAPAGTRYVRPVIGYENVATGSTDWTYIDNAYLGVTHPAAQGREWILTGGGSLSNKVNWSYNAQVENNSKLYFGNAIQQASTVAVDGAEAIARLTFFSDNAYRLQGAGQLTIGDANPAAANLIDVRLGSHRVSVNTQLAGDLNVQVLPGASVAFDAALSLNGNQLTKLGAGTLSLATGFVMDGGAIRSYAASDAALYLGADAVLDGDFELLLAPGQVAQLGDLFRLASYAALSDTFDGIVLPSLPTELAWEIEYGVDALIAEVVNAGLPGDFNNDGSVDAADYTVWRDNFGAAGPLLNDGGLGVPIGSAHYELWRGNFGETLGALNASSAPVPEPGAIALLLLTLLAQVHSRRR